MAEHARRPRQSSIPLLLLLFFLSLLISPVISDCYFPQGNAGLLMSECRKNGKGTGVCCNFGDSCVDRICSRNTATGEPQYYRGACTDRDWNEENGCPDICTGKGSSLDRVEDILPCPRKDEYTCGSRKNDKNACDAQHRIVLKGLDEPYDTIESPSPKPSTSWVTTGSSTETGTMPPTDTPVESPPPVAPSETTISSTGTSTDPAAPTNTNIPDENDGQAIPVAVGIAVGTLVTVASCTLLFFFIRKKRRERPRRAETPPPHHFHANF